MARMLRKGNGRLVQRTPIFAHGDQNKHRIAEIRGGKADE
jgi:hypothetical protein